MNSARKSATAMLVALLAAGGMSVAHAQKKPEMSFFLTSVGGGRGADLDGLNGADAHCQELAKAAGAKLAPT